MDSALCPWQWSRNWEILALAMRLFAQVSLAGRWGESSDPPQSVRTTSFPVPLLVQAPDNRFSPLPALSVLGK